MKRCSSHIIKAVQIKTTLQYHISTIKSATIKKQDKTSDFSPDIL